MMRVRVAFHCPSLSFMRGFLQHGQENKHLDIAGQNIFVLLTALKENTPVVSTSFCFRWERTTDGCLILFTEEKRATQTEWWQQKSHMFRDKPLGYWPNIAHGKTTSRLFQGFFYLSKSFLFIYLFFIWYEQIAPFSRQISVLGEFQIQFIRLTDSLPLQSYRTCRRDLHLGKLETITDHSELNWLIILLIKNHKH